MTKFKKILSVVLILLFITPLLAPVGVAFAQGENRIIYTYKSGIGNENQLESIFIRVNTRINTTGPKDVTIITEEGTPQIIGRITVEEGEVGREIPRNFWINNPKSNMRITSIIIGDFILDLSPAPKINKMEVYDIHMGEEVSFTGERLNQGTIEISGEEGPFYADNPNRFTTTVNGTTGYKTITLKMDDGNTTQSVIYPNAFKLLGNMPQLGEKLEIIPKMGAKESIAYIKADGNFTIKDGEAQHSVFFLTDPTDRYTANNMAEIVSATNKILKIKIPKGIEDSKYYDVIVTNKVTNPKGNIYEQITATKKVDGRFFVIGADKGPVLTRIDPSKGPDTGETVQITGKKFDEMDFIDGIENPSGLTVGKVSVTDKILDDILEGIIDTEIGDVDKKEDKVFHIEYDVKDAKYKSSPIISADRYIATYIGDRTTPHVVDEKPVYRFSENFDNITVKLPQTSVEKETEVNVVVVMQTEIKTYLGDFTIINIITNDNVKYTIIPSHTPPSINKIVPEKIQVIKDKTTGDYGIKEDMVIGIEGQNFKVIRSKDPDTKKDITNYPVVGLGANMVNPEEGMVLRINPEREGQVEIYRDGKWTVLPGADMMILDSKGNIVDGTIGKDTGNKIIITIPKSVGVRIPEKSVTTDLKNPIPKPVYVMNPILGSKEPGYPVSNDNVTLMFVDLKDSLPPTIDKVEPNVVAIDSGEEITVTGSNFQQGIRVFVGGVEVTGVKQELDPSGLHTVLKFNAPKFPQIIEGPTKLMVMNPDGGQASKDFTYVKSLQRDPVLMDFSPKKGTLNTIVVVDGDNFLAPNPAVSSTLGMDIYKLIGSRILMDGKDINEYNIDSSGNISLEKYKNDNEYLIIQEDNTVKLSSYYHSIILEDKNRTNNFYIIYQDNRGNIILSDGGSSRDESSIINEYYIMDRDGRLIAEKDGQEYDVTITPEGEGINLTKDGQTLELIMKTPYKFIENGEIYGSRVHVIDKHRIEFKVPQLTSKLPDGYKITVENPDTKKSTAKDLFYYYETVSIKPEITAIKPSIGSIEGGYQILIEGKNFEDDSKVYIDGLLVPASDVKREIRSGVDTLIITKMPPYRRNMAEEGTDRKVVPVVVENGNGGTALSRFTYVIPPSAKPIIDKVEFQKETQIGSSAGNEVLTITGRYFKFEEPWSLTKKYRDWIEGERNGVKIYFEDLDGDGVHTSYSNWIDYIEKDGSRKNLPVPVETFEKYLDSPVLPKVRIGGIEAKIVEFGTNYIKVITPQITPGRHELYVVNNDFGTSNRVFVNFEGSKITIDRIVGDTGKKQGRDNVEIIGSGFQNSRIRVLEEGNIKEYYMPKVRFGTIGETKDINNNRAQVTLENGDFTLEYDNSSVHTALITMSGKYNKKIYKKTFTINNYDGEPIYLPVMELKNIDGEAYPGYELVKIEVKNGKLIVEKGYSPETKLINSGQISLKTPSYYTIGEVQVEVENPDGGRATTKYRYTNPQSKPRIINITKDGMDPVVGDDGKTRIIRLDYRGGQNITVLGEDFREGARIQIGNILNIENKDITETLNASPNKLSFIMPKVNENAIGKLYRLTVINGDGAQTSSDNPNNIWNAPIYFQFIKGESNPELNTIEPDKGPATGGTKVTIKGKDFRDKMEGYEGEDLEIFFGDNKVPYKDIKIVDHSTIEVIAPESQTLGPVRVKVENPDGSLTQQDLKFTYISKPKIDDVNPKKLFINDDKTEVTITGSQFIKGAKVIVGGKIIPLKDLKSGMDVKGQGIIGVDSQGNNKEVAVIGGMEGSAEVVSENEIKVRFKEPTDLENSSIIIINPDEGISDPYDEFKYEKPVPLKPMVLEAIPGYESTVMLIWNKSDEDLLNKASKYEIYGRKASESSSTFIGSTTEAQYLIKGLEPDTEYVFQVRALNEYGAAIDFAEVKVKTLSIQEDYKQREKEQELKDEEKKLIEKGKEEIIGKKIIRTIGIEDIKNKVGNLDFNKSKYKDTTELTINIPIALARDDSTLNIKYGELQMTINPKDMYTYRVSTLDKGDKDSNLQINIKREGEAHIPRGKRIASRAYEFNFKFQVGKNIIDIDKLLRTGKLTINLDSITYSNAKNVALYKFDIPTGKYIKVSNSKMTSFNEKGRYILLSDR
ncbi:IPT/TIG domain-containing protein [Keratinibaculum paraultunense]|uniref:IPT/TIG domain-containing protein n=1 Tax=Keratinibaculum paraultunense TaxID=1278232 RepID=A0A4R3KZI6_9FIRM|nr:IPT/TIG domain-containing protein [Keratinibaculum paraultunense]QQY79925.1 IPT/TIG domain-containing protein [Keratinibaculum paraultunense]TCS91756.1 IPT/TIG domain-containing protein [Keratinibaculum paraultunense]